MDPSLRRIIQEVFKVDGARCEDNVKLKELRGWDSLAHMEFIVSLESEYGMVFTGDEIVTMATIGDVKRVVATKPRVRV